MSILEDGTVIQDGLRVFNRRHGKGIQLNPYPTKAIITNAYYSDDENNADGDCILCDLHVMRYGLDIFGVPFYLEKASADNFVDYRPVPSTKNIDHKGDGSDPSFDPARIDPKKMNGDMVLVVFVDGDPQQAAIIKIVPSTQSGANGKCPSPRKGRDAGDHYRIRMNGLEFLMDKDGNLEISSSKTLDEKITQYKKVTVKLSAEENSQKVEYVMDNTKDAQKASIEIVDKDGKGQKISLDGASKTTTISSAFDSTTTVTIDANGMKIVTDKDVNIECKNASIKAEEEVSVEAASAIVKADEVNLGDETGMGVVTGACICAFTGTPHADVSAKVKAAK